MFDAAVFARDPAGLAGCRTGDDFCRIAGAGEKIKRPVGTWLALELDEIADADAGFDMVGKEAAGRIADADVIGYAAHARVDVGMPVGIDSVRVNTAEWRGYLADNGLADKLLHVGLYHSSASKNEFRHFA